jgi:hypothetical protein
VNFIPRKAIKVTVINIEIMIPFPNSGPVLSIDEERTGGLLGFVTRISRIIVIIAEKALAHLRQDLWDMNNAWVEHR